MKTKFLAIKLIIGLLLCSCFMQAQDYRDPFLGLYHTATPPCNNGNELTPPNHYIYIEKDTNNSTDIFATDTMCFDASPPNFYGYHHHATLQQSDSTYMDGAQLCKFIQTDSLKVIGNCCGFGYNYYLHKIASVGIYTIANKNKEWYLFPNPAVNEFNIVLPGITEQLNVQLLDLNGKLVLEQKFKTSTQIDVGTLPKGVYVVRIKGASVNLSKRVVLVE